MSYSHDTPLSPALSVEAQLVALNNRLSSLETTVIVQQQRIVALEAEVRHYKGHYRRILEKRRPAILMGLVRLLVRLFDAKGCPLVVSTPTTHTPGSIANEPLTKLISQFTLAMTDKAGRYAIRAKRDPSLKRYVNAQTLRRLVLSIEVEDRHKLAYPDLDVPTMVSEFMALERLNRSDSDPSVDGRDTDILRFLFAALGPDELTSILETITHDTCESYDVPPADQIMFFSSFHHMNIPASKDSLLLTP